MTEKSLALQEAVQQMGFDTVEDFALTKAQENLLKEIKTCTVNIDLFEKKYGFDYNDFVLKFSLLHLPLFEKEEDGAEWNAELKQLHILQKRLARLS